MSDAERALLSAILSPVGKEFPDIDISADDYADQRHADIHEAARTLAEHRKPVNPVTVGDQMGEALVRNLDGGSVYLHELANLSIFPAQATYFAEIVAKEATRRRLKSAADWLAHHADDEDPAATHDEMRAMLDRLPRVTAPVKRISETLPGTLEMLTEEDSGYTATGWTDLNRFIGGWRPGAVYVVGARPGVGKSIIGAQATWDVARSGTSAFIASMEMTDDEINTRLLAMTASVNMDSLTRRRITNIQWEKIAGAQAQLLDAPVFYDDRPEQRITEIKASVRSIQRRRPVGLVVVDYLQQIIPPKHMRRSPRHEQVAHTSRALKVLAKELHVPVVALAQVNRASEARHDKHPTMADLRESGAIEADADVILLLHREQDSEDLEVSIEKNRHGQRGALRLAWQAHFARVANHADPFGRNSA